MDKKECFNCKEKFSEIIKDISDRTYCIPCMEKIGFNCYGCDNWFVSQASYNVENQIVCYDCYSSDTTDCYDCSRPFFSESMALCDSCNERFCNSCNDNHNCNDGYGEDIGSRELEVKFFKGTKPNLLTVQRYAGVEIESECGDSDNLDLPQEVGYGQDGSLDDTGIEVQTPPATLDKFEDIVNRTCKALNNANYKATKSCGLHVHVDCRDIKTNSKKISHVIKTVYAIEDLIYSMIPPSRWDNSYCKMLPETYRFNDFRFNKRMQNIERSWYQIDNDDYISRYKHEKYNDKRYSGLNIHSLFFRGTIEFRYHSGSTNPRKIVLWTDFLLNLIDYAINRYNEREVKALFDMETSWDKAQMMMQMLKINSTTKRYLMSRFEAFNTDFVIKFNKGKSGRHEKRINKKALQFKIKNLQNEVKNIEDAYRVYTNDYPHDIEEKRNAMIFVTKRDSICKKIELTQEKLQQKQTGFINKQEIKDVKKFIEIGMNSRREGEE